jgi:CheY-like chemotaxis protein
MKNSLFEQGRTALVLLAEDNPDHAFLTQEALAEMSDQVTLQHVDNGEKCMAFLRRQGLYANAPRPDLILLDIHMPRMDGFEVMQAIAADPVLGTIPVVVLSTSGEPEDINRLYQLGCKSYLIKPNDFAAFSAGLEQVARYWFGLVTLPEPAAQNAG